ncbi:MAG: XRE family transcriptional regulator [Thermodesulfobacteriota bacterium]|nr:XRE family transcriptional regulator [Thermodesulfobacteriota bacterium]
MARKKTDPMEPVGKKIRKARLEKKLTLDNLANETGFSVDYIKEIESGKKIPPVGTLLQLSRALRIDSSFLLKEQQATLEKRVRAYTKRTDSYAYDTLTPGAENKHLKAFRVTIEAMSEHSGVGYRHEGEEFAYVLKGKVEITVGEHVNKLAKDDSLHFNSGIQHNLRNTGEEEAELIVVIFNP